MPAYVWARQQQGKVHFGVVNAIHVPVAILAQIALIVLLVLSVRRRRWNAAILLGFIMVALLGNAFICGALSNPHDRYQSRLIWLPFFAVALLGTERAFALRDQAESGT
jgi:lipoprotein signal peptidase